MTDDFLDLTLSFVEDMFGDPTDPEPKQEDIDFEDYGPQFPKAVTNLICADCGARMEVRASKYGAFYGCVRWPECNGTHGAHPDGSPLGTPADKATREARIKAHFVFDQVWKNQYLLRRQAYQWMREQMGLSHSKAHIGRFSKEQCERLIGLVYKKWPNLHTRYSRIVWGDDDND